MKTKYHLVPIIFILIFIIVFIFFTHNFHISMDIFIRYVLSILSMIFILILRIKEKSKFTQLFTIVSFMFFICDPFFSISFSLIRNVNLLLRNNSFLSNTEGFILFICIGYILLYFPKNLRGTKTGEKLT